MFFSCCFSTTIVAETANAEEACVTCITAPPIQCPSTYYGCPGETLDPNITGYAQAQPGDADCPQPILTYTDLEMTPPDNCSGSRFVKRTWHADYPNNTNPWLISDCTQLLILEDTEDPVFTFCPSDITVSTNCNGVTWQQPTATDDCGIQSITSTIPNGSTFGIGTTTVVLTAIDNCGNIATCSFKVTVNRQCCSAPPSLNCPADVSGCIAGLNEYPYPRHTGMATYGTGAAGCSAPTITYTDQMLNAPNCENKYHIERTWIATDPFDSTLKTTCVQIINLNDNVDPVITNCPSDIYTDENNNIVTWNDPTATDACGTVTMSQNIQSGAAFPIGTTPVTYTFTDNCGNTTSCTFNVIVDEVCDTAPVINCPATYYGCINSNIQPTTTGQASAQAASSLCQTPSLSYSDNETSTGPCNGQKTITRTWTATDAATGLSTSCDQLIILSDSQNPVIQNCPADIVLPPNTYNASWTLPNAMDDCGIASFTSTHLTSSVFPLGTTTVTYTATDQCGNTTTCSFTVTTSETCQTAPSITCPADYSGCVGSNTNPTVTGSATATAASALCNAPTITYTDNEVSSGPCNGAKVIHRTWTATDAATNLTSSCVQVITLADTQNPTIVNCPADIVLPPNTYIASWSIPTATDDCGISSFSANYNSGDSFPLGTTTVTYTAVDVCGNTTTCSFTVSTSETCVTAPSITCPANYSACVNTSTAPAVTGFATGSAASNICATPVITYTDNTIQNGPCTGAKVIERTWTATDPGTNLSTSCIQKITLSDSQVPTLSNCPTNIVLNPNTYVATWNPPNASDDCGIASFTSNYNSGDTFPLGTTTVTYTAVDICGNQVTCSFTVSTSETCTTAPSITCPANFSACVGSSTLPSVTGTATAQAASNICQTPTITHTDNVIPSNNCAGAQVIERTWTATDNATGLSSSCVQIITLADQVPPTILNCPTNIALPANTYVATWAIPTATDDCGVTSFSSDYQSGDTFPVGTTTVTYTAVDVCGNVTTCSFTVTSEQSCQSEPVITCPATYTTCINTSIDPSAAGTATAQPGTALCDTPLVTYSDVLINNGNCNGEATYNRIWTATDPTTGLTASCTQRIRVRDNNKPVITNCPADININDTNPIATWNAPNATDACGLQSFTSDYNSGDTFPIGTTTVTYTATDNCGNVKTCSFTVTVGQTCSVAPVITCPTDFAGCIGSSTAPAQTGQATATTAGVCGTPTVTFSDVTISTGPCTGAVVIERTWTATEAGLTSSCIQLITLKDDINPVITNCPSDIFLDGSNPIATWNAPSATDNCILQTMNANYNSGDVFPEGTTVVVYTAVDFCGNVTQCSFNVTVSQTCNVPPSIVCPADYTGCPGGTTNIVHTGQATASTNTTLCQDPVITHSDNVVSNGPCNGATKIERTWTATDPETGLSSSCVQLVILEDTAPPTIANCPADIILTDDQSIATWTTPTVTDDCGLQTFTSNYSSGDAFPLGTTTVIYTATDNCGNTVTCQFDVTVITNACDTAPAIVCPSNFSTCPGSDFTPTTAGQASATSGSANCGTPALSFDDVVEATYSCNGAQEIHRKWKAVDAGNSNLFSNCTQIITIVDNSNPTISCPVDIVVSDPSGIATWTVPTGNDNCGVASVVSTHNSGDSFPIGNTTVTYTVTDNCGNTTTCSFDVFVIDSGGAGAEFTSCPDDIVVSCDGSGANVSWSLPEFSTSCASCTSGEIQGFVYMGEYNGHKYYCSREPALWEDAKATCQSLGGNLAIINDAAENSFLANILTIQSAYIGLSDSNTEGTFEWCDGTSLGYNNWHPGQPNDYQGYQDYVELLSNGEWNDQYNHVKLEYIMEVSCASLVQTAGPAPGSEFPSGTTTVEYTITDGCGSSAICSFDVTVSGGLSIECPKDTTFVISGGQTGLHVAWQTPIASSCCTDCGANAGGAISGFVYMGSFGGSHYYCSREPALWPSAKSICEANGGHLAIIESAAENSYLANILTIQSAYIGCSDSNIEGEFEWVNGQPVSYTNWYPGQPNNYQDFQDYVELLNDGQWNDQYNNKALEYIMEIPGCLNVYQTGGPSSGSYLPVGTTTVTYTATDGCGNQELCSFNVTIAQENCNARGVDSWKTWIQKVQFGSLWSQSGNNNGYYDFTNQCVDFHIGHSYELQLMPGYASTHVPVYWKVYVDWNQDGDYTDSGEYIAQGNGTQILGGTIQIPNQALNGQTTMRVMMKKGGYPTGPCEVFDFGEVEDYCLNITGTGGLIVIHDLTKGEKTDKNVDQAISLSKIDKVSTRSLNTTEITKDGTGETVSNSDLIFPNPAIDVINIKTDHAVSGSLINSQGQRVSNFDVEKGNSIHTMNIQSLKSGVYFIQLLSEDGTNQTHRFIKQGL